MIAGALAAGGVEVLEITLDSPGALDAVAALAAGGGGGLAFSLTNKFLAALSVNTAVNGSFNADDGLPWIKGRVKTLKTVLSALSKAVWITVLLSGFS